MSTNSESPNISKIAEKLNATSATLHDKEMPAWEITGDMLIDDEIEEIPTLIYPILQQQGLVALVGSSDVGKSTFLRQLAISIATGRTDFMGFEIKAKHHSVVYVSSEDDEISIRFLLTKQKKSLNIPKEVFRPLRYVFETDEIIQKVSTSLEKQPADMVIVDAFADLYGGNMNQSNDVRCFLEDYSNLAKKHECLIVFLHHTGKRTEELIPSKNNILGSQGFEAKMRTVIEIRKDFSNPSLRHLCIVKGNYLPSEYKNQSFVLKFDDNMLFHNQNQRVPFEQLGKQTVGEEGDNLIEIAEAIFSNIGITYTVAIKKIEDTTGKVTSTAKHILKKLTSSGLIEKNPESGLYLLKKMETFDDTPNKQDDCPF